MEEPRKPGGKRLARKRGRCPQPRCCMARLLGLQWEVLEGVAEVLSHRALHLKNQMLFYLICPGGQGAEGPSGDVERSQAVPTRGRQPEAGDSSYREGVCIVKAGFVFMA